jgi:hypothetical protein
MASGTIVGPTFNTYHHLEIDWTSTPNASNNTSSVVVKMYLVSTNSINYTSQKTGETTVNGGVLGFTSDVDVSHGSSGGKTLIYTRSAVTVTHNSDGTKSIGISGWFEPDVVLSGSQTGRWTVSGTVALDNLNTAPIKVWNGSAWQTAKNVYVWNGSGWQDAKAVYVWNGTAWQKAK